ncbi:MAG: DUF6658 family protein [Cyanobacteriota bacterium]
MNKVISWLKSIRLDRILTVFLAGVLLFASTACGGSKVLAKSADDVRQEVPSGAVTSPYQGGMNNYSDVDPRKNTSEAQTKAKGLVDNAQRNIDKKSVDSREQYVENYQSGTPLGERVRRLGEDIGEAAEDITEEASDRTQRTTKKAADAAQSKVNSDLASTKRAMGDAAEAGDDLGYKIQRNAQDTTDTVKAKVNRGIGRTQQAIEDAADAID